MKIVLPILCVFVLSLASFAQDIRTKTPDGKAVLLKSDGTWIYAPPVDPTTPATVHIYRLKEPGLYNRGISFFVDGKELLEIRQGDSIAISLKAGKHSFRTNKDDSEISIDVGPGEKHYVYLVAGYGGFSQTHILTETPEVQAELHLRKTKSPEEKQIKDKTLLAIPH